MDYASAIEPVTMLKSRAAKLIQIARVTKKPVLITQKGRGVAVLVDLEAYEEERKKLLMLQFLATGEQELRQRKGIPQEQVRKQLARLRRG